MPVYSRCCLRQVVVGRAAKGRFVRRAIARATDMQERGQLESALGWRRRRAGGVRCSRPPCVDISRNRANHMRNLLRLRRGAVGETPGHSSQPFETKRETRGSVGVAIAVAAVVAVHCGDQRNASLRMFPLYLKLTSICIICGNVRSPCVHGGCTGSGGMTESVVAAVRTAERGSSQSSRNVVKHAKRYRMPHLRVRVVPHAGSRRAGRDAVTGRRQDGPAIGACRSRAVFGACRTGRFTVAAATVRVGSGSGRRRPAGALERKRALPLRRATLALARRVAGGPLRDLRAGDRAGRTGVPAGAAAGAGQRRRDDPPRVGAACGWRRVSRGTSPRRGDGSGRCPGLSDQLHSRVT